MKFRWEELFLETKFEYQKIALFSKTNYPIYLGSPLFYFRKQIIQTTSALLFSIFQNKLSKLARLSSFLFSNKRLLVRTCRTMH